jgi:K+-transporting ATPase KdpF subunit
MREAWKMNDIAGAIIGLILVIYLLATIFWAEKF